MYLNVSTTFVGFFYCAFSKLYSRLSAHSNPRTTQKWTPVHQVKVSIPNPNSSPNPMVKRQTSNFKTTVISSSTIPYGMHSLGFCKASFSRQGHNLIVPCPVNKAVATLAPAENQQPLSSPSTAANPFTKAQLTPPKFLQNSNPTHQ